MTKIKLIETPVISPGTTIEISSNLKLSNEADEESQVVVHCNYINKSSGESYIRIWETTYLYDMGSSHISKLVHAENITMFPTWKYIARNGNVVFTLIFTGLPKSCTLFSLIEKAYEPGRFYIPNITRNNTDVYFVDIL
ncbi:MAG: hypothetical protein IPM47_00625 [Sphingobacteriales bacterium]|nr:MAG: hypothetical protein IPM47_00625 [Sphingobacteriales bacterium]